MKHNRSFLYARTDLPVADALVEAIVRLRKLTRMEANMRLTETDRRALQSAIRELKKIIQRNVC